jgi:hypothetical protein
LKRHEKCSKLIDEMRERLALYEMKLISLNMNRIYPGVRTNPPSPVFERRVIYQLKEENGLLQQQVAHLTTKLKHKNAGIANDSNIEEVKGRLTIFHRNLTQAIDCQSAKRSLSAE